MKYKLLCLTALIVTLSAQSKILTLEEALKIANEKNESLKAAQKLSEAARLKEAQGDLELSPYLTAKWGHLNDQKPTAQPAFQGTQTIAKQVSLGVAKKFSTGTAMQLTLGDQYGEIIGTSIPFPANWNASLTLGITQSLWKDSFGRATRLRQAREDIVTRLQNVAQFLSAQQTLIQIEQAYWNYLFAIQDTQLKTDSLARAEKLVAWMNRRVSNSLADRSDLLQTSGLLSSRRLALISAKDEELSAKRNLESLLASDLSDFEIKDDFKKARNTEIPKDSIRLDALLAKLESELKFKVSDETKEQLKPDLKLIGSYASNAQNPELSSSLSNVLDQDRPTWMVGVEFSMLIDLKRLSQVKQAAALEAEASKLKSASSSRESAVSREELVRRKSELSERIKQAEELVKIQKEKVIRERNRLERGRTVTFQVITFEQDQSEAEALLLKLLIEQRKLEANSKIFVDENFGG